MSFPALTDLSSLAPSGSPVINQATEPAAVRNGSPAAKQAYQEGLDFEQVLVNELAQELTSTVSSTATDASSGDGSGGDSADGTSGLLGSDAASAGYESMIPGALTSALISGGGTGLALQLAQAIDPAAFATHGGSASATARPNATGQAGESEGEKR